MLQADIEKTIEYDDQASEEVEVQSDDDDGNNDDDDDDNHTMVTPMAKRRRVQDVYLQNRLKYNR